MFSHYPGNRKRTQKMRKPLMGSPSRQKLLTKSYTHPQSPQQTPSHALHPPSASLPAHPAHDQPVSRRLCCPHRRPIVARSFNPNSSKCSSQSAGLPLAEEMRDELEEEEDSPTAEEHQRGGARWTPRRLLSSSTSRLLVDITRSQHGGPGSASWNMWGISKSSLSVCRRQRKS